MSRKTVIRVAAPLADGLIDAGLVEQLPSEARDGALQLVVDASLVVKDVASVLLAVAAGARGVRAVLDWVRDNGEADVVVTIHTPDVERTWTLKQGVIDDSVDREISQALRAVAGADVDEDY
jgi:hypothetical protein